MSTTTRIGTAVAGYRIEALLGRGGMSVVYLAEHERLGRKVALKLLTPTLSADADFRERFERESRRAAEIDHPNIIPIYDAGEAEGVLYIAMRYVNGGDLKGVVTRDGPLGLGRTLFVLEQAAAGLDAAHDHNLVHRDVKPANILIEDPSERIFVTDFGVAKHTGAPGLTRTGLFIGTVDYAAPEQIEGMQVDARTDVYALGCVLYEALAGRAPFVRDGEVAVMHAHISEPPPLLTAARSDLPKALDRVVATAMAKAPEQRFASCGELIQAARAAALHLHAPATTSAMTAGGPTEATAPAEPSETPVPDAVPATDATSGDAGLPPAAAAAPASADDGEAPRASRRGAWPLAVGLALLAALVSGGLVYLLAGGSDEPASVTPTSPPAATPPSVPAEPGNLEAVVPATLWRDCAVASTPQPGATSSAICLPTEQSVRNRPDRWELSSYPTGAAASKAYEALVKENGVAADSGTCSRTSWGGEGEWIHGNGGPGGRQVCFFSGNGDAVIAWTHAKLDQPTHADVVGVARMGGANHATLFGWWRFWVHFIGKTG